MPPHVNTLFYSENCQTCRLLITMLQNTNLIQNFKMICVDGRLEKFAGMIDRVPTMLLANRDVPLVGDDIFTWVKNVRFIKYNKAMSMAQTGKNNLLPGYSDAEMGSGSDTYAVKNENTSMALPQTFFGYKQEKNNIIMTPPKDTKITAQDQKRLIADEEQQRNIDDAKIKQHVEKNMIDVIIENKKKTLQQQMMGM